MVQYQLKLRLNTSQEQMLEQWLFHLTGVWNWTIRKIEQDAKGGVYYTKKDFQNLLANHGKKIGIPSHVLQGVLLMAWTAWRRCFKKISKKPRLKGKRNRLASIPFSDPFGKPNGNYIMVPSLGRVRFHKQPLPEGKIKCGRIVKKASGWYLCLFIDAQPNVIPHTGEGIIGIDPGFKHLITLSTGEKKDHPDELRRNAKRLEQAQRGGNKRLAARIQERIANQRKDRNHKLSRKLVAENAKICWLKDKHKTIARTFGKSVASAAHGQLRLMLNYKCTTSGRSLIEVNHRNSTKTCTNCWALSGPTGLGGLKVRQWQCACCGKQHDRDHNSAMYAAIVGAGIAHEGDERNLKKKVA